MIAHLGGGFDSVCESLLIKIVNDKEYVLHKLSIEGITVI